MSISLKNVTKNFGQFTAIKELNLQIGQGVFGLLGPNGAGKTTLMKMLVGLLAPTSGQIEVDGIALDSKQNIDKVRHFVNYLPQEFGLYPSLKVAEELDYFARLWGHQDFQQRTALIERLLGVVGLSENKHIRVSALSGGMRQRLGIAITLLNDPKILIVDEPTAGLDPEERIRFRNFLSTLAADRTIILSTHIVADVESISSRLAILKKGQIIYNGEIKNLLDQSQGFVWSGTVSMEKYFDLSTKYKITLNIVEDDHYHLRILSHTKPGENFIETRPTLEEAYLKMVEGEVV